jgi:hypothetical protein
VARARYTCPVQSSNNQCSVNSATATADY